MGASSTQKPALERFLDRIPLFLSYVILCSTWVAFTLIVSLDQVLFTHREITRFVFQFVIFNTLWGACMLSLIVASNRNPGKPNPLLAPSTDMPRLPRPERRRPEPIRLPPLLPPGVDKDDVPLRFLRNSKWVHARIGKDRPSPLPLPRSKSPARTTVTQEAGSSGSSEYGLSPFPLSANPFIPQTVTEAGEDLDDKSVENERVYTMEDASEAEQEVGKGDEERLLSRSERDGPADQEGPHWCKRCEAWKPDRAHHCRHCGHCVLKMDHHCAWLGTCVGFHNYKPFLLLVTYGTLLSIFVMVEAGRETFRFFNNPEGYITSSAPTFVVNGTCVGGPCATTHLVDEEMETVDLSPVVSMALAILGIVFTVAVGSLAAFHWWLASNNMTTLENISFPNPSIAHSAARRLPAPGPSGTVPIPLSRSEKNCLRREARDINVYDVGFNNNLRQVFGSHSVLLAFVPFVRAYRNYDAEAGHFFDVDEEKLDRLVFLTDRLRQDSEEEEDDSGSGYTASEVDAEEGLEAPATGSSGAQGDDESSDIETANKVDWFNK